MRALDRALRILLHGDPVATLVERRSGETTFFDLHFEPSWVEQIRRPVLSLGALGWRLQLPRRFKRRPPPFLTNLLPERFGALRRRIARAAHIDENDEMALLHFVGGDMSGALTAEAGDAPEMPRRVVEDSMPSSVGADRLRWSLGGMQLKFSVDRTDRLTLQVGSRRGRWILKIPEASRPGLAREEYAAMEWARAAGFEVPSLEIVDPREVEGLPPDAIEQVPEALLVRRFDRSEDHLPIHMEELTSVLQVHPEEKYSEHFDSHPGYHLVEVGRVVKRFSHDDGLERFVSRVVFDVLVGNGDAHLKNWSFVFPDRRTASLAPVYDVVPTVLYDRPPELALHFVGGKAFNAIDFTRIKQFAGKVNASPEALVRAAKTTVHRALDTFEAAMADAGLPSEKVALLRRHWQSLPLVRES